MFKQGDTPFDNLIIDNMGLKQVSYRYSRHMDEIVNYCVKHQDKCKKLYPTLEKLGLYYGNNKQLKKDKQGIDGDEGGHVIASILNGAGEKINMVPMNANLNQGAWKQVENTWVKALQEGKIVKVKIEPVYNGGNIRSDSFRIRYAIDGGQPTNIKIRKCSWK